MATDSSSTYEERRVRQGLSSIEAKIEIEATPTIFLVTKELKETLTEAYTPQRLGLGANHHLSPHLHVADTQKRAVVKEIIDPKFSLNNLLEEKKDLEPVIRSNYDNYLDLEPPTLAYIMAIDSLYLLAFLQSYHHNSVHKTFAEDVLKLENQIPAAALTLAGNKLGLFLDHDNNGDVRLYADFFYDFCRAHSPLKLAELRENLRHKKSKHLLAHLYYLILNNQGLKYPDSSDIFLLEDSPTVINSSIDVSLDSNCSAVAAVEITPTTNQGVAIPLTSERGEFESHRCYLQSKFFNQTMILINSSFDGAEAVIKPYRGRQLNQGLKDEDEDDDDKAAMQEFLPLKDPDSRIPIGEAPNRSGVVTEMGAPSLEMKETVIKPFRTVITILQAAKIEEIQIPSASELSKKFNVDFKPTHRGIRGIKFQAAEEGGGEANTLYLPGIKLESDSEVVLRNLVAYEAALFAADSGSKLELTDYVDLMCGIVDTTEDVKLLRNKGIIEEGGLSDEKISEMFNGINKSTAGGEQSEEEKSESQKAVEEVKKMVEELESKMMWKRACKFCNKIVKTTKELLVKKPAIIAMKYLTYIFLAALLILQILQAYCDIYDCSRKESQTTNVAARLMSVI
nr:putative UPF0481 protein At3g02645 [Ipomoea batatas]